MGGVTLLSRHERFRFVMQNMGDNMPYVKYLVVGDRYKPESVFDEDFALVDDEDPEGPAEIPDVGYDPSSKGGYDSPGRMPSQAESPENDFEDDPFNPKVQPVSDMDAELDAMMDM